MCLVLDSQLFDGHRKYDVLHVTKSPNTFSTSKKKSRLQAFQTLGQETKKFFKRRIPNNFTITPINFGLEGIVYPLWLCFNQNSDGLLTNFLFFSGPQCGRKKVHPYQYDLPKTRRQNSRLARASHPPASFVLLLQFL